MWTITSDAKRMTVTDGTTTKTLLTQVAAYLFCAERNCEDGFPAKHPDERSAPYEIRKRAWAAAQMAPKPVPKKKAAPRKRKKVARKKTPAKE